MGLDELNINVNFWWKPDLLADSPLGLPGTWKGPLQGCSFPIPHPQLVVVVIIVIIVIVVITGDDDDPPWSTSRAADGFPNCEEEEEEQDSEPRPAKPATPRPSRRG